MTEYALRLLSFSSLFPNPVQTRHGIFVAERLRQLVATGEVTSNVVAPVPWFPLRWEKFGRYAEFARVPPTSDYQGLSALHPRYPALPKIGMSIAPVLLAAGVRRVMQAEAARADIIDAHFLYPDGVAAVILGRALGKPVVLTARGSDVNQFGEFWIPRQWLRWSVRQANHVFTVSAALRERLLGLGAPSEAVTVARNGVDLQRFAPMNRDTARKELSWALGERHFLSVGNLLELKGHHVLIEALASMPDARLVIVGEGPMRPKLLALIDQLDLAGRVQLKGIVSQAELQTYYAAADLTLLASSREGMPNVVLESLACGTPVLATAVGGVPEILNSGAAGGLVSERSAEAFCAAIKAHFSAPPSPQAVRRHAEQFAWQPIVTEQLAKLREIVRGDRDEIDQVNEDVI